MNKKVKYKAKYDEYRVYDGEYAEIIGTSDGGYPIIRFNDGFEVEAENDEIEEI